MERKLNLKVGEFAYIRIEEGSNASRGLKITLDNTDEWIREVKVVKIGRKYITVEFNQYSDIKFNIEDDYREHYIVGGANWKLYGSKEDITDEFKAEKLYSKVKVYFNEWKNNSKYSLNQLQDIINILEIK